MRKIDIGDMDSGAGWYKTVGREYIGMRVEGGGGVRGGEGGIVFPTL